ncbi:hypothetical protein ILYODFUR_034424 [Ilyodon furcidens]|uniref:Uncharacterized protein n=1 Tax=Ilyodon furcidens TaxID=33524 RepID=A0ABV0SRJ6_9TELE
MLHSLSIFHNCILCLLSCRECFDDVFFTDQNMQKYISKQHKFRFLSSIEMCSGLLQPAVWKCIAVSIEGAVLHYLAVRNSDHSSLCRAIWSFVMKHCPVAGGMTIELNLFLESTLVEHGLV